MNTPPPPSNIFQGTKFPPNFQKAIWIDICNLKKQFPNLIPVNLRSQPYSNVGIQGYIDINISGQISPLPLKLILTDTFPNTAPLVEIPIPNQIPCSRSAVLLPNRAINVQAVMQWVPRQSTLPALVTAVGNYFCRFPPYNISYAVQVRNSCAMLLQNGGNNYNNINNSPQELHLFYAEAISYAESILTSYNKKIVEAYEGEKETILLQDYLTSINEKISSLEKETVELQKACQQLSNPQIPIFNIPPELLDACKQKAAFIGMRETQKQLQQDF